jgi:hypothetical protein
VFGSFAKQTIKRNPSKDHSRPTSDKRVGEVEFPAAQRALIKMN